MTRINGINNNWNVDSSGLGSAPLKAGLHNGADNSGQPVNQGEVMEETVNRPCPDVRGTGETYWASGRNGTLSILQCDTCGITHWYPRPYCPHCGAETLRWVACSGKGIIHTFTVARQSGHKYFKTKVPYVIAMVALAEGPLMMTNIVDCDIEAVRVGAPVSVIFEDIADNVSVPLFRLDAGSPS